VADDNYLAACRPAPGVYPLGYVPHNHHFLWFAASMSGEAETAMEAARGTAARTSDPQLMRMPGFEAMQNFALTPLFAMVRFGHWDEIVASPMPDDDLPYMQAMWHYAQGIAAVRQEKPEAARSHRAAVERATKNADIERMMAWERYSLLHGVKIAERVLSAEIAAAEGDLDKAVKALREAVSIEDGLPYDEPPGWHLPVRHMLGAMLLDKGEFAEAEKVYREELRRNPENGWSLRGLAEAIGAQDRGEEAAEVYERFERAWLNADIPLSASLL
jgi:tetratricopeptide (TPR) repeat protein